MDHGTQISREEVGDVAKGGRGLWSFNADKLIVFMEDVVALGHSMSESTSGARSRCFLLNN